MTAVAALLAGLFAVASPRVLVDYQVLTGYPEPHTPSQYNRTFYLRYSTGSKPDTILVLVPGVFLGATAGSRLSRRIDLRVLRWLFVAVLTYTAVQMLLRAMS